MSAIIVRETWKPLCGHKLEGLAKVLRIRADVCLRKRNHRGRCVGRYLVWDRDGVIQLQERLNEGWGKPNG